LARELVGSHALRHCFAALVRAARLYASNPHRAKEMPPGTLLRQLSIALRSYVAAGRGTSSDEAREIGGIEAVLREAQATPGRAIALEKQGLGWLAGF
jgi:hypothetical protein